MALLAGVVLEPLVLPEPDPLELPEPPEPEPLELPDPLLELPDPLELPELLDPLDPEPLEWPDPLVLLAVPEVPTLLPELLPPQAVSANANAAMSTPLRTNDVFITSPSSSRPTPFVPTSQSCTSGSIDMPLGA